VFAIQASGLRRSIYQDLVQKLKKIVPESAKKEKEDGLMNIYIKHDCQRLEKKVNGIYQEMGLDAGIKEPWIKAAILYHLIQKEGNKVMVMYSSKVRISKKTLADTVECRQFDRFIKETEMFVMENVHSIKKTKRMEKMPIEKRANKKKRPITGMNYMVISIHS
jgi:hypothetical protein